MPESTNIATYISEIQTSRNKIRNKFVDFGISASTDKLDALATAAEGIDNQGAVQASVKEGETYTIPKGYHNGAGTVQGVKGGGNYTLQTKTVTPTKKEQSITSDDGYYGLSGVTVGAIPDNYQDVSATTAAAGNVLAGKVFTSSDGTVTTGTMSNNGAVSKTLDNTTTSYTIPSGYHNGKGIVQIVPEADKTVTPSATVQTISPASGKVLSTVTVNPIPVKYGDTSDATATADKILSGEIAYTYDATAKKAIRVSGTMPNNGALALTIDGMTAISATIPAGYTSGGTVSLTDDIEKALAAI